ncbi:hypothetical protein SAMN04515669_2400 [Jiangella sp. DSM 45060]|nr:hypothetical protein SAMN04515669_2400 [Jiangella sp. DSM 45060]
MGMGGALGHPIQRLTAGPPLPSRGVRPGLVDVEIAGAATFVMPMKCARLSRGAAHVAAATHTLRNG